MKVNYQAGFLTLRLGILMSILLLTGCIHENLEECPQEIFLSIKVLTESDEDYNVPVDGATVYIFDQDGNYLSQIPVRGDQISKKELIALPIEQNSQSWIVVWGNIKNRESISPIKPGASMDKILIGLKKDEDGFTSSPDDLFYGIKQMSGLLCEEIEIAPKTGRINLTVKGLQDTTSENYYFTIETHYDGYSFAGVPHKDRISMKFPGVLNRENDLVTPQAYNLIHYPQTAGRNENYYPTVKLWKKNKTGSDELLLAVNKDINNEPIIPQRAKTLNVLLRFQENGEIEVTVVLTGWNEIAEWLEW